MASCQVMDNEWPPFTRINRICVGVRVCIWTLMSDILLGDGDGCLCAVTRPTTCAHEDEVEHLIFNLL